MSGEYVDTDGVLVRPGNGHRGRTCREESALPPCKSIVVVPGVPRARAAPVVAQRDVGPRADDDRHGAAPVVMPIRAIFLHRGGD